VELAAAHLGEQGCGELGAGAAERMAEGDGSSVDVDAVGIEAQFADDGQRLRGKGLVEFDEADVRQGETSDAENLANGGNGAHAHLLRQAAGSGVGQEAAEGVNAQFMGTGGFHQNCGSGAVGGLRGVAGGDGSLCVEGGFEFGQGFERGVGARTFVGGKDGFGNSGLACIRAGNGRGDGYWNKFIGKTAGSLRGEGLAVAGESEGVLIGAGDGVMAGRPARR
jgi:hypothetical protein